jgi:hypothetical protein
MLVASRLRLHAQGRPQARCRGGPKLSQTGRNRGFSAMLMAPTRHVLLD